MRQNNINVHYIEAIQDAETFHFKMLCNILFKNKALIRPVLKITYCQMVVPKVSNRIVCPYYIKNSHDIVFTLNTALTIAYNVERMRMHKSCMHIV
jgi:hypothetical protein